MTSIQRFTGDLWNATPATITAAATAIMAARSRTVRTVKRRTTGLWVTVVLDNGTRVNISDDEIRRQAWQAGETLEVSP